MCVLGIPQPVDLSEVKVYLFLEGFDRVFAMSIGGAVWPNV